MDIESKLIDVIIPTYNPKNEFIEVVSNLCDQSSNCWHINVIIVDDGSTKKKHIEYVDQLYSNVKVLRLKSNKGRSYARNYGAKAAKSNYLIFLDADCVLIGKESISRILDKMSIEEAHAVFCKIAAKRDGLWGRYFLELSEKRDTIANNNDFMSLTSACFAIRGDVFHDIGGFDENYRNYGFEDKDIIATLIDKKYKICYAPEIIAIHKDHIKLNVVCAKMEQSGQFSAPHFAQKHSVYYKKMRYAWFDTEMYPILLIPARFISPLLPTMIKLTDIVLNINFVPYKIKRILIQALSALSFMKGSSQRQVF